MDTSALIMSTIVKRNTCQNGRNFKHECTSGQRKTFRRKVLYLGVGSLYGGMTNLFFMLMTVGGIIGYIKMRKPSFTQSPKAHRLWLQTMCQRTLDGFALRMGNKVLVMSCVLAKIRMGI